jgi:glycosyltransferase involved in cell wall biosynthesis
MAQFNKLVVISRASWTQRNGITYFQDNDGFYIDQIASLFREVSVWSRITPKDQSQKYGYQFRSSNIKLRNIMRGRSESSTLTLGIDSLKAIRELQEADVVFSFVNTIRGCLYAIVAKIYCNTSVVTYNGIEWQKSLEASHAPWLKRKIANFLEQKSMSLAQARLVTGPLLKNQFESMGPTHMVYPVSRLLRIDNPVSESLLSGETVRLICPVHLHKRKRLDVLIQACARLKATGLKFTFDLIGDGPERKKLESLVCELKLNNEINFHGYISDPDHLAVILTDADILVFAGQIEGFPRTIWEAIHFGLYIICAPVAQIDQLFSKDEITVVKENSAECFERAILGAVAHPERTNRAARKATQKMNSLFNHSLREQFRNCVE